MLSRCGLVFLTFLFVCSVTGQPKSPDPFIQSLFDRIQKEQVQRDQHFSEFKTWDKTKGLYPSYLRLNVHGKFPLPQIRWNLQVFDDSIFPTMFITSVLLEAFKFGSAPCPSDEQLLMTLDAMCRYYDKSKPYNTSLMFYWKQKFDESANRWKADPGNLYKIFSTFFNLPLSKIATLLLLSGERRFAGLLDDVIAMKDYLLKSEDLPTDFDTAFANIAIGSWLYRLKDDFPSGWRQWKEHNSNITSVFDAMKQYAYRPFSADPNSNTISPASYFYLRKFLDQAKANGQDVALITTWAQDLDDERKEQPNCGIMPFFTNVIDVHVAANVIYEITSGILCGLLGREVLEDPKIAQIYENTTSLIDFELRNNFSGRPDLAMSYYSSKMQFCWFVSRMLFELESANRRGEIIIKVMEDVYRKLRRVLEDVVTKEIISTANQEGDVVYFDDILGNADFLPDGRPVKRGEDRIFTTSAAANTLLNIWTYFDEDSGRSYWKEGTPQNVRTTVKGCVDWLRSNTLEGLYEPWNSLLANAMLGSESFQFWFPGNRIEHLNGTRFSNQLKLPEETFIYGVQGYIQEERYNAMLKESHFGRQTPKTFSGFNSDAWVLLFVSSDSWTYSNVMLAVSRFSNTADQMSPKSSKDKSDYQIR